MNFIVGQPQTIELSNYATGIYLLEIINGKAIATKKIIIE